MTQQGPDIHSTTAAEAAIRRRTIDEELAVPPLPEGFARLQQAGILLGLGSLVLCLILVFLPEPWGGRQAFFRGYLVGYLFWLAVAVGSLAWVMVHYLTGGDWGLALFRPAEAASRTLPLMALLFIPILLGYRYLFPWANVGTDQINQLVPQLELRHMLEHQADKWFSIRGYIYRGVICFAVWCALAFWLSRVSIILDRTDDLFLARRIRKICAFGIVAFILSATSKSFDLVQSREAAWFSSIHPLLLAVNWALSALVFLIAIQRLLVRYRPFGEEVTPGVLNDIGNLFLTCTILWAYMSFAQLLIIWMGNIKTDTPWYVRRGIGQFANGWSYIALLLLLFHFFVPFFLLLMRWTKRHLDRLTALAVLALFMRWIDVIWSVVPSSMDGPPSQQGRWLGVSLIDILMPVALGGIWIFVFVWILGSRPLLTHLHPDPRDEDPETTGEHRARDRAAAAARAAHPAH